MPYEPPTQLASPPTRIVNALNESPLEQLRDVVKYAEVLAEHKERRLALERKQIKTIVIQNITWTASTPPPGMSAIPQEVVANYAAWPVSR